MWYSARPPRCHYCVMLVNRSLCAGIIKLFLLVTPFFLLKNRNCTYFCSWYVLITDAVGCDSARRALSAGNFINALVYVVICLFRQPKTFDRICFLSIICVCLFNQTESKEQQVITFIWLTYGHACGGTPQAMPKLNFISCYRFWKLIFFVFFYYFFKFYSAFNFFCKLVIIFIFFMFLPNLLDEMVQEYLISVTFHIQSKCICSLCLIIASKHKNRR